MQLSRETHCLDKNPIGSKMDGGLDYGFRFHRQQVGLSPNGDSPTAINGYKVCFQVLDSTGKLHRL